MPRLTLALIVVACLLRSQTVDIGTGAPSEGVTQQFVNAFFRNNFFNLVSTPPIANVTRFGPTGLVQEFRDAARTTNVRLALVKSTQTTAPPPGGGPDVVQVYANLYAYYSAVGVSTAGYPLADTALCPDFQGNSCQYQFFDKSYVLFAYQNPTFNGQNFSIRNLFYTKWTELGGIGGLSRPTDMERAVTIQTVTATVQTYANGAIYSLTSGLQNGQVFAVRAPIYSLYAANQAHEGFLGLPTGEEIALSGGRRRQTFQGGSIEYSGSGDPVLLFPVSSVSITPASSGSIRLSLGETVELRALMFSSTSQALTDRPVTWSTTNLRVASILANGVVATVRAVGGGNAVITASSEGKVSPPLNIFVSAPCCQIGEGAPNPAIQQSFQDAVTRNRLTVQIPARNPVRRLGAGYAQELQAPAPSVARYLVARSDAIPTAYVVSAPILAKYEQSGGPGGPLGHPLSDAATSGHQLFEQGVLAAGGAAVYQVAGSILSKWAALGHGTGAAGPPAAEQTAVRSSTGFSGFLQTFNNGAIIAVTTGPRAGQAYFVSGPILARYVALGGPAGPFGFPVSDEFGSDGRRRQNFEGGYFDHAPGATIAEEHAAERRPSLSAFPAVVPAGSRVRLTLNGFPSNVPISVSISGQQPFAVTTLNGAHTWETYVALSAAGGMVTIRGEHAGSGASAQTSYVVRATSESGLELARVHGDAQTGAPGARLPEPLRVILRNGEGEPIAGAPVRFEASPGAQIIAASAATDQAGRAEALVRMPLAEGVALITAESSGIVTTFGARVTATDLIAFPRFSGEPLPAAVAMILRFHQNRGELPGAFVDPAGLVQSLKTLCVFDADGRQVCDGLLDAGQINLWRLAGLVNGQLDVSPEKPDLPSVRDLVAQGSPVLIALTGGHYVVATGIASNGSIRIQDPATVGARSTLEEYLSGASIVSAVRLRPVAPSPVGFLVSTLNLTPEISGGFALDIASAAGSCGRTLDLPSSAGASSRFRYCDGLNSVYQLTAGARGQPARITVTDLSQAGRVRELTGTGELVYQVSRRDGPFSVGPQSLDFSSAAVVNAATFQPGIAPGGITSIFGNGLAAADGETLVEFGGVRARLLSRAAFQLNVEVPPDLQAGIQVVRINSPFGAAERTVVVTEIAPVVFIVGPNNQGAVVNQDGKLNSIYAAARRGQVLTVYGTGFGAVESSGPLWKTRIPLIAFVDEIAIPAAFAGLTPGFIGLYQANVPLPADLPPGLDLPLVLRQGGVSSNPAYIAIQ